VDNTPQPRRLAAILAADVAGYTRLVEQDTDGTVAAWKAARDEVIKPLVASKSGHIIKFTGDGFLVEFPSVEDAVTCAIALQGQLSSSPLKFRMGLNVGDITDDGGDVHGEGVNIAARIEALADPGGICVSGDVHNQVRNRIACNYHDMGEHQVKHVTAPVRVWRIDVNSDGSDATVTADLSSELRQDIRFCKSADGVTIAYASVGNGPPLVKAPNWMHHLEYDWKSPVWGHLLRELSRNHTLVRFDQRCNGLSDWDVPEVTFETMIEDMSAVVDAAGLTRFPLLGISAGCYYSIAYTVRHPERVSRLILYGGVAQGRMRRGSDTDKQQHDMQRQMISQGWGQDNPAFRQFFTSLFMPGATKEQMDWFNELQRTTVSPENAVRLRDVTSNADVSQLLGKISVPTLVLHCRDDGMAPFERGRRMAAMIPNARFVALDSKNHLILEDEPAWPRFLAEVTGFLAEDEAADAVT
jgi:class 3 adenylate cyclase/pimeloyl-ACP methyl ester carboxylesterase